MAVCLSPGGQDLFVTESAANELLVGTVHGVIRLTRANPGGAWEVTEQTFVGCHISSLVWEPTHARVVAGLHGGGLYVSADNGHSWERKTKGLTFEHVYTMACTKRGDKALLFAGTEPAHLFQSDDLGESWHEWPNLRTVSGMEKWWFANPPHQAHVKHIAFDPRDTNIIFVSVEQGGLLKSEDGGATWRALSGFYFDVHRVAFRSDNNDVMMMSGGEGVYESRDRGETWEHLTDRTLRLGYPDPMILCPTNPDLMFMAGGMNRPRNWRETRHAGGAIARSKDAGRTWTTLGGGLPENMQANVEAMCMNAFPGGFNLFAGTSDGSVYLSEDGGDTWSQIAKRLPSVSKGTHYAFLVSRATLPADADVDLKTGKVVPPSTTG